MITTQSEIWSIRLVFLPIIVRIVGIEVVRFEVHSFLELAFVGDFDVQVINERTVLEDVGRVIEGQQLNWIHLIELNGELRVVGLRLWLRMIGEAALQIGHHLVPERPEVEHLPLPALQLPLHLLILIHLDKLLHFLLRTFHTPRLLQDDQAVLPDLVLPVRCLSERIVLEIHFQSFYSSQRLKHAVISDEIACDVEIVKCLEWHEIVESALQAVAGEIELLKMGQYWKVLKFAEIAVGERKGLELRVGLKDYLRLSWDELEIERGDDDGSAIFVRILPLQQLPYYLCIVGHSIIARLPQWYSNNCHSHGLLLLPDDGLSDSMRQYWTPLIDQK